MSGIQGIGGVPEPVPTRTGGVRDERDERNRVERDGTSTSADSSDGVSISQEAQQAADASRIAQLARSQEEIRADRVEAARQAIERGDFRNPEIVRQVAERIERLI